MGALLGGKIQVSQHPSSSVELAREHVHNLPRSFGPELSSKLLADKFARDQLADWRVELHRRRTRLQAAQDDATAAAAGLTAAHEAVKAAGEALAAYHRGVEEEEARKAAQRAEEGEEEPPTPLDDEEGAAPVEREAPAEEVALEQAKAAVVAAEVQVRETGEYGWKEVGGHGAGARS